MFIDLLESASEDELQFDLCIVGAGPAGIALARRLRGSGIRVALLESGMFQVEEGVQELAAGTSSGLPYLPLQATRLRRFGGTTGHWGGQSAPLDPQDFAVRDWIPHSGWPIAYADFARYIDEAADECAVPRGGYEWDDIQYEPGLELPLPGERFTGTIMRYSKPPRDFGEYFRDEIAGSPDTTCLLHANVTEVVPNDAGNRIAYLCVSNFSNREIRIVADRFVLACGAIENARLLLASKQQHPDGLGNDNGMVGRFFMEHPNFDSGLINITDVRSAGLLVDPWLPRGEDMTRLDFKLKAAEQQRLQILNHSAYLVPSDAKRPHLTKEVGFLDKVWRRIRRRWNRTFRNDEDAQDVEEIETEFKVRIRLEHAPNPDSRVTLANDKDQFGNPVADVAIRFGDAEGHTVEQIQQALALQLGAAGLGRMRIDFDPTDDAWQELVGWQIHQCGGTRMAASPSQGVVDENCKLFGVDNLWIAGSSVFPCAGHANPTMNLVALALRLGDHLKESNEV